MITRTHKIRICGMASAVPNTWRSLDDEMKEADESGAEVIRKFVKSTGVVGRFLAGPRQTTSDLCYAAAEKLLSEKKVDRNKIGVMVFVTQTEDYRSPSSAMVIQHRLGIGTSCICFDVNLGCSGFTSGLSIAGSLLQQSESDYALLMCGDTSAREKDPSKEMFSSNADKMLFGDSGTATLLVKDDLAEEMLMMTKTDGNGFSTIITPYEWYRNPKARGDGVNYMDGIEVFNFSTSKAPEIISELMKCSGRTADDYDCLVLHQANKKIIERIGKLTGFNKDKNITSIEKFGNTSSASIPNTMVYHFGDESEGQIRCMMCGYGVGLAWSAVDCLVNKEDVMPLVQTDEFFEDGYYVG